MSETETEHEELRPRLIVDGRGGTPEGVAETIAMLKELGYEAREGYIPGCETCGHLSCVCTIQKRHTPSCRFRLAATCPVDIGCDLHDRGVCPECDACNCGAGVEAQDFGPPAR